MRKAAYEDWIKTQPVNLVSKDIISGQKDASKPYYDNDDDTDEEWVQNGSIWTYKFKVIDDTREYYVYEEPMDGYSSDQMQPGYIKINADGNITKSAVITNKQNSNTGSLSLEKHVTGDDLTSAFTFDVTLTGDHISGSQIFGNTAFTNGKAVVSLKDGETIVFDGIPEGTTYSVAERSYPEYDTASSGTAGTIVSGSTAKAVFNNVQRLGEAPDSGIITLKKQRAGSFNAASSPAYTFTIRFSGLAANAVYRCSDRSRFTSLADGTAAAQITLEADKSVSIGGIPVGAKYRIQEAGGDYIGSYQITDARNLGLITQAEGAAASENTDLTTEEETLDAKEEVTVTFTNTYNPRQTLTVSKKTTGKNANKTEKFPFTILFFDMEKTDVITSDIGRFTAKDQIGAEEAAQYPGVTMGTYMASKDFTLSDGESVSFAGIKPGIKYIVTEGKNQYTPSYAVTGTSINSSSVIGTKETDLSTALETVDAEENGTVTFTNTLTTKTAAIRILKKDKENGERLSGAEFKIKDAAGAYLQKDGTDLVLTTSGTGYTDEAAGLAPGTYTIVETKAPDGYQTQNPMEITVSDQNVGTTITVTIEDEPARVLQILPATGSIGICIFLGAGAVIMLSAAVLFIRKRQQ